MSISKHIVLVLDVTSSNSNSLVTQYTHILNILKSQRIFFYHHNETVTAEAIPNQFKIFENEGWGKFYILLKLSCKNARSPHLYRCNVMRCNVLQLVRAFAYPATSESNNQNYGKISLNYLYLCATENGSNSWLIVHIQYIMNNSEFFLW